MGLLAGFESEGETKAPLTREDKKGIALLIVLYVIQGVPVRGTSASTHARHTDPGRNSGWRVRSSDWLWVQTLPFLLRERLSYSKIAIFTLSSYPYSLKLLWSPFVDSWFFPSIGRRRSWIIPMQTILGSIMLWMSFHVQVFLDNAVDHIYTLTVIFTLLVVIAATQDIAVDGWSLTLLSRENISYASTCQTVGLTTGWLMSFTVFLALNSEAFRFWSIVCFGVTLWLICVQKERKEILSEEETNITSVRSFIAIHLTSKVGFAVHDAATSLKMVEKGLSKEDFAAA
ncbi:acetyl-coenzyme A transporter 1-domain-containing protein, partial [Lactarius hengduanensis]